MTTAGQNIANDWSDVLDAEDVTDLAWRIDETMKAQVKEIERLKADNDRLRTELQVWTGIHGVPTKSVAQSGEGKDKA